MKRVWSVILLGILCVPTFWVSACLNPRPEDFPSGGDDGNQAIEPPQRPSDEGSCGTNPYAQDCEQTGHGNMTPSDPTDPSTSSPPDAGAAPVDAGTDAGDAQDAD